MRLFPLVLGTLIFSIPLASAEPPAYVTGLEADVTDGEVYVRWQPVPEAAYYRVFLSYESILANEGLYDDFETTEGSEPSFILKDLPDVDTLFIAVIAVNGDGEDSGLFVEEITVQLHEEGTETATPPSTLPEQEEVLEVQDETLTIPDQQDEDEDEPPEEVSNENDDDIVSSDVAPVLRILSVISESPTMVTAEFSTPIIVDTISAPDAIRIVDSSNNPLFIRRATIEGSKLSLETMPQIRNASYSFVVNELLQSAIGLPLDTTVRSMPFTGHPDGIDASMQEAAGPLQALQGLKFSVVGGPTLYSITAEWMLVGNPTDVSHYIVKQSRDGGKTYGEGQFVAAPIRGIRIDNITPGLFGLSVTPVKKDGESVPGEFISTILNGPATRNFTEPSTIVNGSITQPNPRTSSENLSDSGLGTIAAIIGMIGAILGWYSVQRRANRQILDAI